jgi:hypothetical protein
MTVTFFYPKSLLGLLVTMLRFNNVSLLRKTMPASKVVQSNNHFATFTVGVLYLEQGRVIY